MSKDKKRKACKNCTCGRAEQEALTSGQSTSKRKLTLQMLENPGVESSCGSVRFPFHYTFGFFECQ